jgi:putative cardiolipin synthase
LLTLLGKVAFAEKGAGQRASAPAQPYLHRVKEEFDASTMSSERPLHWTAEAKVISDPPERANGSLEHNWLADAIFAVLRSARSELQIISPYFIPGDEGVSTLRRMAAVGVDVSVLTNSLAATDVAAVHGAYAGYRAALLASGVSLFELRPRAARDNISLFGSSGASLHAKPFMVDGRSGFIGSFNFDPRSISLNTEMGVLFTDEALTQEVRAVFAEQIAPDSSYRLQDRDGEIVWLDGHGGSAR